VATHELKSGLLLCQYFFQLLRNEITVYSVDNNDAPAAFHYKEITQNILYEFSTPEGFSLQSNFPSLINPTNVSPPDYYLANAVSIADICVFRI
jgi:hypothetical protein